MGKGKKRPKGRIRTREGNRETTPNLDQDKLEYLRKLTEPSWKVTIRQTIDSLLNTELTKYTSECLPSNLISRKQLRQERQSRIVKIENHAKDLKLLKRSVTLEFKRKTDSNVEDCFPRLPGAEKLLIKEIMLEEKLNTFNEMLWNELNKVEWDFEEELFLLTLLLTRHHK